MKTYNFSVEVEDFTNNGSFIDKLQAEIKDEKKQLDLTHKINLETSKVHKEILEDFVSKINVELKKVGVEFGEVIAQGDSNLYAGAFSILKLGGNGSESFVIGIKGQCDRNFKDSKYTTYTGEYWLAIGITKLPIKIVAQIQYATASVKSIEDVLEYIRFHLKTHVASCIPA